MDLSAMAGVTVNPMFKDFEQLRPISGLTSKLLALPWN